MQKDFFFGRTNTFQKFQLLDSDTVIQPLNKLNKELHGVEVYVKRDDLMGIGLGGNKLRKLEYLIGDAIQKGSDVLITSGGVQSNHARLTAVAASYASLEYELVLSQPVPKDDNTYMENGNILLEKILDAKVHLLERGANTQQFIDQRVQELERLGKKAYTVPMGGSSAVGCLGYAACFQEIINYSKEADIHFDTIVIPNGSGGTHAGLLAGMKASGIQNMHIKSYTVLAPLETAIDVTYDKAKAALRLIDEDLSISKEEVDINADYLGTGYGVPTDEMIKAVKLLARTEGIFLDPVYSGKAFAGLLSDIHAGKFENGSKILFVLTGGLPGLFAYESTFANQSS